MSERKGQSRRELLKKTAATAVIGAAASVIPAKAIEAAEKIQEGGGLPRWAMILDLRRCVGCRACTVACKSEFSVPLNVWSAVVKQVEYGEYPNAKRVFLPRLCNHCSGEGKDEEAIPPCVEKCPEAKSGEREKYKGKRYRTGATYKRPDGAILLDNKLCIGCGKCIDACPYGVRYFNKTVKLTTPKREKGKDIGIGKCTFCSHRIDNGIMPSCVNTCLGRARIFGDLNDPDSEVSKLNKEFKLTDKRADATLLHDKNTLPYVFYIDPDNALKRYAIDDKTKLEEFRDKI